MDRKFVEFIKEHYPPGTRIRLDSMEDPWHPIPSGTEGAVDFVDDEGQIFMKWDNGRTLPLAPGEDRFAVLPPKLATLKLYMPLIADLYERNEYGEFDDSSTLLEGNELQGYEAQITAALVKNRVPEETERGIIHWYDICWTSMVSASGMKQETMFSMLCRPPTGAVPTPWSIGGRRGLICAIRSLQKRNWTAGLTTAAMSDRASTNSPPSMRV